MEAGEEAISSPTSALGTTKALYLIRDAQGVNLIKEGRMTEFMVERV